MKHVDTGAIRTEMYRRRIPAMLIGFLYIAGMILFGAIGAVIGGQMTGGGQGLVYFGIAFVILYIVGIALLNRLREYRY